MHCFLRFYNAVHLHPVQPLHFHSLMCGTRHVFHFYFVLDFNAIYQYIVLIGEIPQLVILAAIVYYYFS